MESFGCTGHPVGLTPRVREHRLPLQRSATGRACSVSWDNQLHPNELHPNESLPHVTYFRCTWIASTPNSLFLQQMQPPLRRPFTISSRVNFQRTSFFPDVYQNSSVSFRSVRSDVGITLYFCKGCTFPSYYAFNCLYFYADNTYVSSSENDEDVLVTTEPIPVIFHRIATGNRNTLFVLG